MDDEDALRFLSVLSDCKQISGFEVYAYCLMPNHVHLLIKTGKEPLGLVFKRVGSRYVFWYNRKYQRIGPLFQDRFKSEAVEDDSYFLTVLRYIMQNPMKAGLEDGPGQYRWSSYFSYAGAPDQITDTGFAVSMFSSREALVAYLQQTNDDMGMDLTETPEGVTDERAAEIMKQVTKCRSAEEFQVLDKKTRKEYVAELREKRLSLGQIERLTGMPKATIYRATK